MGMVFENIYKKNVFNNSNKKNIKMLMKMYKNGNNMIYNNNNLRRPAVTQQWSTIS